MNHKLKRFLLFTLTLGLIVMGSGYATYRGYVYARQTRLIKQAKAFIETANVRKAQLCLQRALRYNPKDVEACRLMARLGESVHSPAALVWRTKVVELNPRSLDDRLALAQTALAMGDYASATNALEGVEQKDRKTAGYHNMAGAVAAGAGKEQQAESHFLEAIRLEPENAAPQMSLAVVRLQSTNITSLAEARATLRFLCSNPTNSALRCQALRELIMDSIRYKEGETALAMSGQLLQETNSVFQDRLLRLLVLQETRSPEFKTVLGEYQLEATNTIGSVYEMAIWQIAQTSPGDTLTWLKSLPMSVQTNQQVAIVLAESQRLVGDWRGLEAFVRQQNWGDLECIRRAFKARALRGQELSGAAKAEWELALKSANGQKGAMILLLRMAAEWQWQSEAEELLWAIVNRYPNEKWASRALSQALFAGGRTRSLMQLYREELKRSPTDITSKNNLAMTAMLLEAKELRPYDLAREAYQKAPTNAAYASTYAFALYLQNKSAEALKIMQNLTLQELDNPSIAGYYGLILKATGTGEKGRFYLERASNAALLPEEKKLFERAKAGI